MLLGQKENSSLHQYLHFLSGAADINMNSVTLIVFQLNLLGHLGVFSCWCPLPPLVDLLFLSLDVLREEASL